MEKEPTAITIILISEDRELFHLCRSVAKELFQERVAVRLADHGQQAYDGALRIWDITAVQDGAPEGFPACAPGDLVIAEAPLPPVMNSWPKHIAGIVVKPVERVTLRSFMAAAVNRQLSNEVVVDKKLSERQDLLQALLEVSVNLQQADQNRTSFLARALHDFRAPLTALHGYTSMLLSQQCGPLSGDQAELLRRMEQSISRLSRLSKSMFELSIRRHTEPRVALMRSRMDERIHAAANVIRPMADSKQIQLSVEVDDGKAELNMDPDRVEQVLVNLLENACKFTPRHGCVTIRAYRSQMDVGEESHAAYRVDVCDNGVGIAPEHIDSVFEEFTSYSGGKDRSGGGLGLAICKMIVSEHQGTIWAESDGNGTVMSFCLPMKDEPYPVRKSNEDSPKHSATLGTTGSVSEESSCFPITASS